MAGGSATIAMGQGFQQRVASALQLPLKQTKLVAGPIPAVPAQARVTMSQLGYPTTLHVL